MATSHPNRDARERALELLYEAEAKDVHPSTILEDLPVTPVAYAVTLAEGVGDHIELLDHLIGARAQRWTVARMPAVDRALLRLATYELTFEAELPVGVVVDEAVDLAKAFSTDNSPKFVNGVLAKLAGDVRDGGPWSSAARPEALLVDMDGVVRHWDEGIVARGDELLGLEPGTLGAVVFEPDRLRRATVGDLTDEAWRDEVTRCLVDDHGCDPGAAAAAWRGDEFTIDAAVIDLVRAVRAGGHPVALLSNATTRLEADLEASGLTDAFDTIVNSSRVALAKPDAAIFAHAADAVGVPAALCLFVDDRPENVAGALAAGMPAARFRSPVRLEATLRRTDLLLS
jgi:putative hydrolase of the HAD superfamily